MQGVIMGRIDFSHTLGQWRRIDARAGIGAHQVIDVTFVSDSQH